MNIKLINKLKCTLPDYPIEKAWLFGSFSRGEETRKSDVDLLVRFDKNTKIVGLDYIRMMNRLEETLHKRVDLVKEGTLKKFAVNTVEKDKILIYERAS
ncbi:MAG: nucleotidyltransferase domain-containing protein [Prevotellaceae bacterium]|jgi:predicted nucleotidyltransferase|nr:nucleotidyltransferase domain-containing protein [Prevotellaceae bacterium]